MWGFQKNETRVLILLCILLLAGTGIRLYQNKWSSLPEIQEATCSAQSQNNMIETDFFKQTVSLNKATQQELENLRGIGPVIAKRILKYRTEHDRFKSLEELKQVKGIGEKTFEKIKSHLTLD